MVEALSNEDTAKIVKHISIRDKIKRVWVCFVVVLVQCRRAMSCKW